MNAMEVLSGLSGVPFLQPAVTAMHATYSAVENVKLYRKQCKDISARCINLMMSLQDSAAGMEGQPPMELTDELNHVAERINRRVTQLAVLSRLKSFISQGEIKEDIDKLQRDIDAAIMKFNLQLNLQIARIQQEARAIQERDKAEIRQLLQQILLNQDDRRSLVDDQHSEVLEEVMEVLQTELRQPSLLEPNQEKSFKEGLWWLHDQTKTLPPLTDLTGQVTLNQDQSKVKAQGSFNDIFLGQWLDREPVALRLPRALTNSVNTQKRFQKEVVIWRNLGSHPNVVPLYGFAKVGNEVYCVSPWMDNGTVPAFVQQRPTIDRLRLLTEVATGLEYLHQNQVVHGDLRGANVLINRNEEARLSDFGLSKLLEECGQDMTMVDGFSPRWAAPELFLPGGSYSTHSDVWSFGMVMLQVLTGKIPYHTHTKEMSIIRELDHMRLPERPAQMAAPVGTWDGLWKLMRECWQKKPTSRPSATDLVSKLLEIRGLKFPTPKRRIPSLPSVFTRRPSVSTPLSPERSSGPFKRPSTASSESSVKSSSSRLRPSLSPLPQGQPLPSSPSPSSFLENGFTTSPRVGTVPLLIPSGHIKRASSASTSAIHPRQDYIGLDIPYISSSLPTDFGEHFTVLHEPSRMVKECSEVDSVLSRASSGDVASATSSLSAGLPSPFPWPLTSADSAVYTNSSGLVVSGTLNGLVDKLLENSTSKHDLEYRDVVLATCHAFSSPTELFDLLVHRFQDVDRPEVHTSKRVEVHQNIYAIVLYWLSNPHFSIDIPLLYQMKEFCIHGISASRSSTMNDKARELLRVLQERLIPAVSTSPSLRGVHVPKSSEIEPEALAIALTLQQAEKFHRIEATDYLLHAIEAHSAMVDEAVAYSDNIDLWVKRALLHNEKIEDRLLTVRFLIFTAQECRRLRNFASMAAIVGAMNSDAVKNLVRMWDVLRKDASKLMRELDEMQEILKPAGNFRTYRQVYPESTASVPWLTVHLADLKGILKYSKPLIEREGRSLINFERYVSFVSQVKDLRRVKRVVRRQEHEKAVIYLDSNLNRIERTPQQSSEVVIMNRSSELVEADEKVYRSRRIDLSRLGFRLGE